MRRLVNFALILVFVFAVVSAIAPAAFALATAHDKSFDINEVSVLFPLPPASEINLMLAPSALCFGGPLISEEHFSAGGDLVSGIANPEIYSRYLRVVALRLDPCFIEGRGPKACRRQIRLVWQPVFATEKGGTSTLDASMHSFYEFPEDSTWDRILKEWPRVSEQHKGLPLQPNPQISAEGLKGAYWLQLKSLILEVAGSRNLSRVTFMSLPFDNLWTFQGFDIVDQKRNALIIPRIRTTRQTFALSLDPKKFEGGLDPRIPREDVWNIFLKDSDEIKVAGAIQDVVDIADSLNNPQQHNAGTVDCVSCHVAQGARRWVENDWRFPTLSTFKNLYVNETSNLTNLTTSSKTNRIRGFGYFGNESFVSQRVINESAAVIDYLSK